MSIFDKWNYKKKIRAWIHDRKAYTIGFFFHFILYQIEKEEWSYERVPVNCETKYTETKANETKFTETKRNGIIQNEIKPILTKQFLGERRDTN